MNNKGITVEKVPYRIASGRINELKDRRCIVSDPSRAPGYPMEFWWSQDLRLFTTRPNAGVWTVSELLRQREDHSTAIIELLGDLPDLPEGKKCLIQNILPRSLLAMLSRAPENHVIRTQVHARILVPIPNELKAFDQIVEWIENTIDQDTVAMVFDQSEPPQPEAAPAPPVEPENDDDDNFEDGPPPLSIIAEVTGREYGNYSCRTHATHTVDLDRDLIEDTIQNCRSLDQAVENLLQTSLRSARGNADLTPIEGTYTYEDADASHVEASVDFNRLRANLCSWLSEHNPEQLERLTQGQ